MMRNKTFRSLLAAVAAIVGLSSFTVPEYDSIKVAAPFPMPAIAVYHFPARDFSIADFGAKKKGADVEEASKVDLAEERLYRGVSYMTLVNCLVKLFGDYNQARRENKGEESAASRFISSDIQEVIKGLNTIRVNNRSLTDETYKDMEDQVFRLVEFVTGRRDLPAGKNFGEEIKLTQEKIGAYVRAVEPAFRDAFIPFMKALAEQAQKDGNVIKGDDPAAAKGPQEVEIEGEIDPKTGRKA